MRKLPGLSLLAMIGLLAAGLRCAAQTPAAGSEQPAAAGEEVTSPISFRN